MRRLPSELARRPVSVVIAVLSAGTFVTVNLLVGMPLLVVVLLVAAVGGLALVLFAQWQRHLLGCIALAVAIVGIAIQAVPYGRDHTNPPVIGEPSWATPETRELMVRACYSCHSNEVDYPAYANIAPISWAMQGHIDGGRSEVNYSEFTIDPRDADETLEVIRDGSMPPSFFTRFGRNPRAVLTDEELATLIEGIRATPGLSDHDDEGDDD